MNTFTELDPEHKAVIDSAIKAHMESVDAIANESDMPIFIYRQAVIEMLKKSAAAYAMDMSSLKKERDEWKDKAGRLQASANG